MNRSTIMLLLLMIAAITSSVSSATDSSLRLKPQNQLSFRSQRLERDTDQQQVIGNQLTGATCSYPGSPAHASVTFNTSLVVAGTAASYTCDNGYELLGPPRRICQANGTWSPVGIPFCVLNVGLGKAAMQSSTAGQGSAQKAVDGSTSPYFQASTCTMTDVEHSPWWYVNLLEPYLVQIVRIDFGTACCANRQKAQIAVRVGNNRPDLGNNPLCNRYHGFIEEGKPLFLPCTRPAPGAFVSIHLESPSGSSLSICETFIYTDHALSIEQCPSFRDQPLGSTATYNGKCYLFHNNQALNFESARRYCESRGGTLVDETSPALQGFLSWELYRRHRNDQLMGQYWLGATRDQRQPQNWKWINGKDVQISFWNQMAGQHNCSRFDGSKGWLWSDTDCQMELNFICQYRPLSCGKPEKPTNSTLTTKNIDNGTVIEYQCAPGNLLMGPKSRACLPTGFFSEFAPKCKYLDCQPPAQIPNGHYKLLNGTTSYQSLVHYHCHEGYQLYGKASLACDVDERWNGPPPRCEPLLCPAPVPPSNGYVTVTNNVTVPGTQAAYECRPGYELVGDRLLSCSQTGSWDLSFPYCRERRTPPPLLLAPAVTAAPAAATTSAVGPQPAATRPPPTPTQSTTTAKPQGGTVQFPGQSSSIRPQVAQSSTVAAGSQRQSTASLNGLAGQFMQSPAGQQSPPLPVQPSAESGGQQLDPIVNPVAGSGAVEPPQQQQVRKPSQSSNSVSQFAPPEVNVAGSPALVAPGSSPVPLPPPRFRPAATTTTTTASVPTQTTSGSRQQQQFTTTSATSLANNRAPIAATGSQNQNNKFPFNGESTPQAASNSVSVHSTSQQPSSSFPPTSATSSAGSPTATSSFPPMTTHAHATTGSSHLSTGHHQQSQGGQQNNVLASFSPPIRAHNTLASARYSLDGIIAVAIFGGFIFLGAIITIIVIIIRRRKGSHSSSIDGQTISTYDSNGEHNGLYRNYQQAWENLRFATPSSQPKSSGGGGGLMGGAAVGLKQFAQTGAAHPHHYVGRGHAPHGLHGHHNLAMSGAGSTTSSGAGSQGSSSGLGGGNGGLMGAGLGPVDPLLRHAHHQRSHHRGPSSAGGQLRLRHPEVEDDDDLGHEEEADDLDDTEQGVLSADETPGGGLVAYGRRATAGAGEGFRDSNELTINADTALVNHHMHHHAHHALHNHHPLHHAHLHQAAPSSGSNSSSQHQRLVQSSSSTTPSTSTRSSRASPPSDDQHSLEQLAYGNQWHPNGGSGGGHQNASSGSSSQRESTGSGASILRQSQNISNNNSNRMY